MFKNQRGDGLIEIIGLILLLISILAVSVGSVRGEEIPEYYQEFLRNYDSQMLMENPDYYLDNPPTGTLPVAKIRLFLPAIGMYNFVPSELVGSAIRFRVYGLTPDPYGTRILLREFTSVDFDEFDQGTLFVPTNVPIIGTFEYIQFRTPEFAVLFAGTTGDGTSVFPEFQITDPLLDLAGVFFHQTFQPGPSLAAAIYNLMYISGYTPGVE